MVMAPETAARLVRSVADAGGRPNKAKATRAGSPQASPVVVVTPQPPCCRLARCVGRRLRLSASGAPPGVALRAKRGHPKTAVLVPACICMQ